MDVTALLTNARSPDQATRQQAEAQIEQAKASNLVRHPTPTPASHQPARARLPSTACSHTLYRPFHALHGARRVDPHRNSLALAPTCAVFGDDCNLDDYE